MAKFNLAAIAVAATSFLHLRDPSEQLLYVGEGADRQPVGIDLHGPGSEPFQEANARVKNRNTDRTYKAMRGKPAKELTAAEMREQEADFLATCTAAFVNFDFEGLTHLSGHELFKAVYSQPTLGFVAEQVRAHLSDWENFKQPSPTS